MFHFPFKLGLVHYVCHRMHDSPFFGAERHPLFFITKQPFRRFSDFAGTMPSKGTLRMVNLPRFLQAFKCYIRAQVP
jgi:hypothetical protein